MDTKSRDDVVFNTIKTDYNVHITAAPGSEHQRPNMSKLGGAQRPVREREMKN